jgi:L-alanine-DL-glutamate epimerase-like enolase superfamily enzyme
MSGATPRRRLTVTLEDWTLKTPFRITGHVFTSTPVVVARVAEGPHEGQGEAAGVYYLNDTPEAAAAQLESVRDAVEAGLGRDALQTRLPAGAARNALDCALWDLEWQVTGEPAWKRAGLAAPRRLITTFTLGADAPDAMAEAARAYDDGGYDARALKLKLTGDALDADRVRQVHAACPRAALAVDANQGFTPATLQALWPVLLSCNVTLVEQPFPRGRDAWLDGLARPIPVAADESVQSSADIGALAGRFDVVNIKLDKSGGLTEALAMARRARALGLGVMVGNMTGTSLCMAPAFLLGQICDVADLDGPVFLARDRARGVRYADGMIGIPEAFWGGLAA